MKVLGLIVEYNPFHNGHLYHLEKSLKTSNADYTVCVMSGNYVQRGEPAIINKWARTQMALTSGIDLVIELPFVYAVSSAEYFAFNSVKILNSLGVVDYICFGSETGNLTDLRSVANILNEEPVLYKTFLHEELKKGFSFAKSRANALKKYLLALNTNKISCIEDQYLNILLSKSNNILAIEYLKALDRLNSSIQPLTIKRISNDYNSTEISNFMPSATSIRNYILDSKQLLDSKFFESVIPKNCVPILLNEFWQKRGPVSLSSFEDIILATLRKMSKKESKLFISNNEGLENRVFNASLKANNLEELINLICTKRYTRTTIQRMLINILIGIKALDFKELSSNDAPLYARILGFNKNSTKLLTQIKSNSSIPLISKISDYIHSKDCNFKKMLQIEALASDIYVLGYKKGTIARSACQEYVQEIIRYG